MGGSILIGEVIAVSPRLSIRAGGIPIEGSGLYIAPALLGGFDPRLAGELEGTDSLGGSVRVTVKAGQLTVSEGALNAGDRVVMYTPDGQNYYILCKVVAYG